MNKPRWISHNQNEMPRRLKPGTLVNVWCWGCANVDYAERWSWGNLGNAGQIIAYQIVGDKEDDK